MDIKDTDSLYLLQTKKKYQNGKLNLQGSIQNAIAAAYRKENPKITHFYNNVNYNEVPIWAIFEGCNLSKQRNYL